MISRKITEDQRPATHGPQNPVSAQLVHRPSLSCNSSGTRIGLPGPSRAHQLARWCRFVSIAHREPLQTALQGTFARAMISRKITEEHRPATHGPQSPVSARALAFLQFTWHPNRPSRPLQGISARAMVPICVHRASRTPPDSTPGHIRSRDD